MNTRDCLENVNNLIADLEKSSLNRYRMNDIYHRTGIFDWFKDYLTITDLKQMRSFLNNALKLGFEGYVCFKVGATGCANGMWAHKNESTNGYSPDGDYLYRSFTSEYTYYAVCIDEVTYPARVEYDCCSTVKKLKDYLGKKGISL